jgi:hypothetical protein
LTTLFGQTNWRDNSLTSDTCIKIANEIPANSISGTKHSNPLYIANDVVICGEQLDTTLLVSVDVLKCPKAFYRFNYAGVNGAIIIKTRQEFKTVTVTSIRDEKYIKGNVIYALNGYYLTDTTLKISIDAIREIEINKTKVYKGINPRPTIINIWTLTKKERQPMSGLCRGIGITTLKLD